MGTASPANSPQFLRARSPQRLRALMRFNNIKRKAQHAYKIIQGNDGFWYAWFEPYWLSAEEKSKEFEGVE